MIVKGPITKIHSYDDPKLFNSYNTVSYTEALYGDHGDM